MFLKANNFFLKKTQIFKLKHKTKAKQKKVLKKSRTAVEIKNNCYCKGSTIS